MTREEKGITPEEEVAEAPDHPEQKAQEPSSPPVPDLRTARVLEARDHPNADRLLVMKIDLGSEERQIVAGIVGHYELEELVGKPIVVVANLQHAKLRGEVSQGMLLASENEEGVLGVLLAPEAEAGTPLRIQGGPPPNEEITFQGFHENTLLAGPDGVTVNGAPLGGTRLIMDREVYGKLR
jgi:methionyl-tRNA synthetase